MEYHRHDFLYINQLIPAIVRRQEKGLGENIEVGFSFPEIVGGQRKRIGSVIPKTTIVKVVTPFDVAASGIYPPECAFREPLEALVKAGKERGVAVGVYGSAALALLTNLPYFTPSSDIDILVEQGNGEYPADFEGFFDTALQIQEKFAVAFDIEIRLGNGYDMKLKELFSNQHTVLVKGLYEVALKNRLEVMKGLGI